MARILVIDDDAELLELARLVIGRRGRHQVSLFADGAEGLASALSDPPDLLVIDLMMPEIDGYEVCRQLRANPGTSSKPIIVLTARSQAIDRQAALDVGADDFFAKHVSMPVLLDRINELLSSGVQEQLPRLGGQFALLSLHGGVGVTTLAVNLAISLARYQPGEVCLVDLCTSSGHVALQLGLRPEPNWSALIGTDRVNPGGVEALLLQHRSGLSVLASPVLPVPDHKVMVGTVQSILEALGQRFAVTIVDTSSALNSATLVAVEVAAAVGLVITADAASIQAAVGTLHALRRLSPKFHVILNEIASGAQVSSSAVEHTLKRPLLCTVPFDPAQARALAQGVPLALQSPGGPLPLAIRELAMGLDNLASPGN